MIQTNNDCFFPLDPQISSGNKEYENTMVIHPTPSELGPWIGPSFSINRSYLSYFYSKLNNTFSSPADPGLAVFTMHANEVLTPSLCLHHF